jgi:hypothetical protein
MPKEGEQPQGGEEEPYEKDPYAGTNIDAQHLGQDMEARGYGQKDAEQPAFKRSKPSISTGPDKRFAGLPSEAGNKNVDKRTERRVG